MVDKDIHIRIPQEMFLKVSQFKEKEKLNTNSKAIIAILNLFFQEENTSLILPEEIESNATIKSQELHILSLQQQLEHYKEQIKIKDQQIIGLIGAQGQITTQIQSLSERLEPPKNRFWWMFKKFK